MKREKQSVLVYILSKLVLNYILLGLAPTFKHTIQFFIQALSLLVSVGNHGDGGDGGKGGGDHLGGIGISLSLGNEVLKGLTSTPSPGGVH